MATPRVTVLISGRGSNLRALVDAQRRGALGGSITQVISNKPEAAGLRFAADNAIATQVIDAQLHATREAFDAALGDAIAAGSPDLVVLAGFMRILGPAFVRRLSGRMLNIHPSLLPAYPGLHTHRRALADGVRIHGCTVHFVTDDLDHGPIVAQAAVPVHDDDDEASLAARVLACEHRILPESVRAFCEGRIVIANHHVRVKDALAPEGTLEVPMPPA